MVRPNLLEAGKGSSMSEVENQQLVNSGKVHTGGQWLRGLWVSLFKEVVVVWGVVMQKHVVTIFGKFKSEQTYVDTECAKGVDCGGWHRLAHPVSIPTHLLAHLCILRGCKAKNCNYSDIS